MKHPAFVYRWRNNITGRWYIGYHKGSEDDGYLCSSTVVKPLIKADPTQWTRRILRRGTHQQMIDLERRILTRLQARTNQNSYNRSNGNGTQLAGRPPGSTNEIYRLHPDLRPEHLRTSDSKQLAERFLSESDPHRRYLYHKFIFGLSK